MAITKIYPSFKSFEELLLPFIKEHCDRNYLGGYFHTMGIIVLNLKLIHKEITEESGRSFSGQNKTMEQAVCYCLTHEEIHHWLSENEGQMTSIKFDEIARNFMMGM